MSLAAGRDIFEGVTESKEQAQLVVDVHEGNLSGVKQLIESKRVDIEHVYSFTGGNILHFACGAQKHKIIAYLLTVGGKRKAKFIDEPNKQDSTPLVIAIAKESEPCVKVLLDGGASALQPNSTGHTPVFLALVGGNLPIIKMVIARAEKETDNPNIASQLVSPNDKFSLLISAVKNKNTKRPLLEYLVDEKKLDISARSKDGYPAAFVAVGSGNLEAIKFFVERGINIKETCEGVTLSEVASVAGHKNIVHYLASVPSQAVASLPVGQMSKSKKKREKEKLQKKKLKDQKESGLEHKAKPSEAATLNVQASPLAATPPLETKGNQDAASEHKSEAVPMIPMDEKAQPRIPAFQPLTDPIPERLLLICRNSEPETLNTWMKTFFIPVSSSTSDEILLTYVNALFAKSLNDKNTYTNSRWLIPILNLLHQFEANEALTGLYIAMMISIMINQMNSPQFKENRRALQSEDPRSPSKELIASLDQLIQTNPTIHAHFKQFGSDYLSTPAFSRGLIGALHHFQIYYGPLMAARLPYNIFHRPVLLADVAERQQQMLPERRR